MSEEPSRKVQVILDLEIAGEAARDQLTAERAAWLMVSLATKEWRYRFRTRMIPKFWGEDMDIKWKLLDWMIARHCDKE